MCSESFKELMQSTKLAQFTKMELPSAATGFVPTELAQIPSVLFFTGWSNHQLILNRCKTNEERLFYLFKERAVRIQVVGTSYKDGRYGIYFKS